jgi:hypothetical protein
VSRDRRQRRDRRTNGTRPTGNTFVPERKSPEAGSGLETTAVVALRQELARYEQAVAKLKRALAVLE